MTDRGKPQQSHIKSPAAQILTTSFQAYSAESSPYIAGFWKNVFIVLRIRPCR